ncbi:MAG: pirin family protein [candidate division Zixibacteria bacterium]|nr:pirin family protein [candidate division Zixibacteria bacterium]MCI0596144.1 pirin family protein [candidate division Zixibacteria bacterium]
MITLRPAKERGHTQIGWLNSWHSFSFDQYYDPKHIGFRTLRVINDDRVSPGKGFGMHPHRDMEILTWVLEGALEHSDSMGNGSVIRPGELQKMSAGRGIAHSEYNQSPSEPVHLLQIWILPNKKGVVPSYEQRLFAKDVEGKLRLVASPDGRDNSIVLLQDAELYIARLTAVQKLSYELKPGRYAWVQAARGAVSLNGVEMKAGDGAAASEEKRLEIAAKEDAEILLFDLD